MLRQLHADHDRDSLTGLAGQDEARRRLDAWLSGGQGGVQVHVLLLSLARLDAINLAFGSVAGDGALVEVAGRIVHFAGAELDSPWFTARLGGSTFLLAAREACSRERWALFARGLCDAVARPFGELRLSPRVAMLRAVPGEDADGVLDRLGQAQDALARRSGRRLAWVDGVPPRPGRSAARLEADLLRAIDRDEIEVLFQPQYGLPGNRVIGAEALVRWNHPQVGRIGAGALFALAERTEQVVPLSQHIAARALSLAADWPGGLRVSVNVTAADLAAEDYAERLLTIIAASGCPLERITLEVTEQALLSDIELARRSLERLVARDVRVALDDFGAGFCNFRYLKLLPLHYLKLDRTMVDGIAADPRDLAVLRAIVAMAGALDLGVIAEGIESEAQRDAVEAEGCASWQGFLGAEPMSASQFVALSGLQSG